MEPSGYALVVSTENITQNWYPGNNRSMLIPNTLFRVGAAAIVLTNKRAARYTAKYRLQKVYRVHLGADDNAFRCATIPAVLPSQHASCVAIEKDHVLGQTLSYAAIAR